MSAPINFAAVKNDAQLAVAGESDGYMLPAGTCDEAVLALVEAVEAAHDYFGPNFSYEPTSPGAYKDAVHGIRTALARFDFGGGS